MSEKDWCVRGATARTLTGCLIVIEEVTEDGDVYSSMNNYYFRTELTPLNNGLNGYRWGVKYPSNGKKPDLPDNIRIVGEYEYMPMGEAIPVCVRDAAWGEISKFKIIDFEYNPVDDGATVKGSLTDDWYDYTDQKMLRNPKEGCVCEVLYQGNWLVAEVLKSKHPLSGSFAVFYEKQLADGRNLFWSGDARPLDWNREAEAERNKFAATIAGRNFDGYVMTWDTAKALYDFGLRYKEDK